MAKKEVDKVTFLSALVVLLVVCIPLILFPEQGAKVINIVFNFMTNQVGFLYIWAGLAVGGFLIWLCISKYGGILFGDPGEEPQFSTFSWAGMLFCAGIGAGIMYWGAIEWAYYFKAPPLGLEKGTWKAAEWAASYGIFHWGPVAWALYVTPALPIAYSYHVKKKPVLKLSEVCRGLLGDRVDGVVGKVIDVFFMFGLIGGAGTSLGVGVPLVAAGFTEITGMPKTIGVELVVLAVVVGIFTISAYLGLEKGIKRLSNINITLVIGLLIFVFIVGPTGFILKLGTTSLGIVSQNFIRMSTWLDPILNSGFPESWTVFYWAWWLVYAPFMGLFIAKISRGRTVRQVVGGTLLYGTMGCAVCFMIFGNYGLFTQLEGVVPVIDILNKSGSTVAIMDILSTLPLGNLVVALFSTIAAIFMATTFDSASFTLAAVATKEIKEDEEPARWNRLFWALGLGLLPAALMLVGGPISTIQTACITTALPLVFILGIVVVSFVKVLKRDEEKGILTEKNYS